MKNNREFIDGIYRKAMEYEQEKENKKPYSILKKGYLKISAACACCACIFLGVVLVKNADMTSPGPVENLNDTKNSPMVRGGEASYDLASVGIEDICVIVNEVNDGEIVCSVNYTFNQKQNIGDVLKIKIPENLTVREGERLLITGSTSEGNSLQFVEGTKCYYYNRTEGNEDVYIDTDGNEIRVPSVSQ